MTTFREDLQIQLVDAFGTDSWDALEAEARNQLPIANEMEIPAPMHKADGSFITPQRFWLAPSGPVLDALYRSRSLLSEVRHQTGMPSLVPVARAYNVYRRNSFIGVHRDQYKCSVTLVGGLTENLAPMGWGFSIRQKSNQEIVSGAGPDGIPEITDGLPVKYRRITAIAGNRVPHWRPKFNGELGIIFTICYFEI